MPSVITNSDYDTRAAAVPAPYGPLTRVGDVPDRDPNSNVKIEATTAIGDTPVLLSYDDLGEPEVVDRVMEESHSGRGMNVPQVQSIKSTAEQIFRLAESYGNPPYTDLELRRLIELVRTNPHFTYQPDKRSEYAKDRVVAAFTVTDEGSSVASVEDQSTGKIDEWMWDWGDGAISFGKEPGDHDYATTGAKTIRLTVSGSGGSDSTTRTITLA